MEWKLGRGQSAYVDMQSITWKKSTHIVRRAEWLARPHQFPLLLMEKCHQRLWITWVFRGPHWWQIATVVWIPLKKKSLWKWKRWEIRPGKPQHFLLPRASFHFSILRIVSSFAASTRWPTGRMRIGFSHPFIRRNISLSYSPSGGF